jgi:hypothetical protein
LHAAWLHTRHGGAAHERLGCLRTRELVSGAADTGGPQLCRRGWFEGQRYGRTSVRKERGKKKTKMYLDALGRSPAHRCVGAALRCVAVVFERCCVVSSSRWGLSSLGRSPAHLHGRGAAWWSFSHDVAWFRLRVVRGLSPSRTVAVVGAPS